MLEPEGEPEELTLDPLVDGQVDAVPELLLEDGEVVELLPLPMLPDVVPLVAPDVLPGAAVCAMPPGDTVLPGGQFCEPVVVPVAPVLAPLPLVSEPLLEL